MIEDFDEFVKYAKEFYTNYKRKQELTSEIKNIVDGYTITINQSYTFEVHKEEDMTTKDLSKLQDILGCDFSFGGGKYVKFNIANPDKGIPIIQEYKQLLERQKTLGKTLIGIHGNSYPSAKLAGKYRDLEVFTSSYWGFRIQEITDEKKLTLDEIIAIEKETRTQFAERNSYGCDFNFILPKK
ncbi:MAG: hypothetical protein IJH63_00765 [Methanobrevibacter sp.]|nr:hypothetical protein [Methanosphaera sp.]MBR0369236.1 hypothetical protein [Methanobrevibacter sp.]